jgi:hypothetical protein
MPVALEFGVDVERVGSAEIDVVMLGRGQVRADLVSDLDAVSAQRANGVAEIGGGSQHVGAKLMRHAEIECFSQVRPHRDCVCALPETAEKDSGS